MWRRSSIQVPLALGVAMLLLVATLTVAWVLILVSPRFLERTSHWGTLALGSVFFALIMVGLVLYMALTMKEVRLNQRQTNFIDSVTHELKIPLASLRMYLQTMQMRPVAPEQQSQFQRYMLDDVERLDTLIDHLLEAARLGHQRQSSGPPSDVELEPLIRDCATRVCQRHRVPVDIVQIDVPPLVVKGWTSVLDIVFRNLLDNAIRYAGERPEVVVRACSSDGRVKTEISDNGTGVPPRMRQRIFRRFERGGNELERTQPGMGLGLYIARALILLLKGKITVEDRGHLPGATFAVTLPGRSK